METVNITVRNIDAEVWAQFKALAAINRKSISDMLVEILKQTVKEGE